MYSRDGGGAVAPILAENVSGATGQVDHRSEMLLDF
jgi:hypothetical protein